MSVANMIFVVAVFAFMTLAAVWDARTRRLPNWITIPALLSGLVFHLVTGALSGETWYGGAGRGLLFALSGFAIGFVPLFLLWILRFGGAGDVKLMGAVGAWLGLQLTFYTFIISTFFLAGTSIVYFLFRMTVRPAVAADTGAGGGHSGSHAAKSHSDPKVIVPYGVPAAVATCLVVLWKVVLLPS